MASKSSHIRSNSFPRDSHPTTLRVQEVLSQINSSQSICENLCRLAELYNSMDDHLNLPSTIQSLNRQGGDFFDASLSILDICGVTREIVTQFKENVRDLQSSLRRKKGDSSMESSLNNYNCFRKKMKKDAKRSISSLKQIDQSLVDDCSVIREVNSTTIAVFQSVLIFLAAESKQSKWSMVSRLVHKEEEREPQNELEIVDSALKRLSKCGQREKIQLVQKRLEALDDIIISVENELERLFRCLIKSRATLLNIFSC